MDNTKIKKNAVNKFCTGCGVCVSESDSSLKMDWNEEGFIIPIQIEPNIPNNVIRVCPFNPTPEQEVSDEDKLASLYLPEAHNFNDKVGRYISTYAGFSPEYRDTSSSGGLATYIFKKVLDDGIADRLYVVTEADDGYSYQFFERGEDIKKISKTRYVPVTMEQLFCEIDDFDGTVAVSGVACFIKAIRLKQYYHPKIKEQITFLIGIICGGWKSKFFTDYLVQEAGINGQYSSAEYRVKDPSSQANDYSFSAVDEHGQEHELKMRKLGDMWGTGLFKSEACDFCTDVLSELADVSLGDAWLPEYKTDGNGNSIIVTRTYIADQIILQGINDSELEVKTISEYKVIESQGSSFYHRHYAIKFRASLYGLFRMGIKLPIIRQRIQRSISIPFKFVQILRCITRAKSLTLWREYKDVKTFNKAMSIYLKALIKCTAFYHKVGRLASRIK